MESLWIRGGFPPSFTAESEEASVRWRNEYVSTFPERDIPQLGIRIPSNALRRFWIMLSHYHGQVLNYSELGRSFGLSDVNVRRYVDVLESTFMVRTLQAGKRCNGYALAEGSDTGQSESGIFQYVYEYFKRVRIDDLRLCRSFPLIHKSNTSNSDWWSVFFRCIVFFVHGFNAIFGFPYTSSRIYCIHFFAIEQVACYLADLN
jgi:hypothetical protein